MVVNEIHGNVLMCMLSVTYNTHTQAELYIDHLDNQSLRIRGLD